MSDDVIGKVARRGNIPLEYYKDPEKSAATFVTAPDGTRYSIPGDFATVEADGTITAARRASTRAARRSIPKRSKVR